MSWEHLADWWLEEVRDPAYDELVTPILVELMNEVPAGGVVADLGSGDGRLMPVVRELTGGAVVGVELVEQLARQSERPAVISRLPSIPFDDAAIDGAYAVLVLEHIEDHLAFFAEVARVVRPGGYLIVISNHPIWTAPGSTPIADTHGETLWRPGIYFENGTSSEPADELEVVFHHRSMSALLNSAADTGWRLSRMLEKGFQGDDKTADVPRLLGVKWART